jgi:hypothetical protein
MILWQAQPEQYALAARLAGSHVPLACTQGGVPHGDIVRFLLFLTLEWPLNMDFRQMVFEGILNVRICPNNKKGCSLPMDWDAQLGVSCHMLHVRVQGPSRGMLREVQKHRNNKGNRFTSSLCPATQLSRLLGTTTRGM